MPTAECTAVAAVLAVRTLLPANWESGLAQSRTVGVFLSPPVAGHTLVVGCDLLALPHDAMLRHLAALSRRFGRAAWFHRDDDGERYGWALAERGAVQRAYAFAGDEGDVLWAGEVTDEERALGCFLADPRDRSDDDVKWWPDARLVEALAARWSCDPQRLGGHATASSVGALGRL